MTEQQKKPELRNDAFSQLTDWLENGDDALDQEMQDALEEEPGTAPISEKTEEKTAVLKAKKRPKSTHSFKKAYADHWSYRILAGVFCVAMVGLLLLAVLKLPDFGKADTLIDSELTEFYADHAKEETGAMNIVTAIILDYRGFDTLGETHVLFIAVCVVLLILSIYGEKDEACQLLESAREQMYEPDHDEILQSASRLLVPMLFVFGLYIIMNGHLSPGGGFSGGAVLGGAMILYQNAFGYQKIERFLNFGTFKGLSVSALLLYILAKSYHFFIGANHLESVIGIGQPGRIFSAGLLLPLSCLVGCVVACVMYALYTMFRRGEF